MIFVSGGSGFLGSHLLIELCNAGKKVRAMKRPSSDITYLERIFSFYGKSNLLQNIEWVEGDLCDIKSFENAISGVEQVYHCAATVTFSSKNKNEILHNNIQGSGNLINLAIQSGVKKFCHVSSIAALGKEPVISEKTVWDNQFKHSVYSVSKYESELEAWRGMAEGLDTIIVSPSVIIGPWNPDLGIGTFFRQVKNGLKYYTSGGNGFVDVRDVAKTMVALMDSEIKNDKFIISSENVSFKDLTCMIADLMEVKKPEVHATEFMTGMAWRLSSLKSFITQKKSHFDKDTARISQNTAIYTNQKISEALNFKFIPIQESLKHTYQFYKL